MSEYFPKLKSLAANVKVEWDLFNYAKKIDLENAVGDDTSSFAKITDLVNSKSDVDKLDIDKWKNARSGWSNLKIRVDKLDVNLSKLSNVVKNDVAKKDEYKIKNIEDKIPYIANLATTAALNSKKDEVTDEIPSISNLATTIALIAVENKVPNVNNLVKKN